VDLNRTIYKTVSASTPAELDGIINNLGIFSLWQRAEPVFFHADHLHAVLSVRVDVLLPVIPDEHRAIVREAAEKHYKKHYPSVAGMFMLGNKWNFDFLSTNEPYRLKSDQKYRFTCEGMTLDLAMDPMSNEKLYVIRRMNEADVAITPTHVVYQTNFESLPISVNRPIQS
jgi:hypothetical protein